MRNGFSPLSHTYHRRSGTSFSMSRSQVCVSPQPPEEVRPPLRRCGSGSVSEVSEIVPVALCAFITWEYTSEVEASQAYGHVGSQPKCPLTSSHFPLLMAPLVLSSPITSRLRPDRQTSLSTLPHGSCWDPA